MEGQSHDHLLHVKRQASLSGSSSADGGDVAECSSGCSELHCPYCFEEPFALTGLVDHIMDAHGYAQRSVKCPICRRPARDMMHHLVQHSQNTARAGSSISSLPSSSRSAKEWLAGTRLECERSPFDWDSYSEGPMHGHALQAATPPGASLTGSAGLGQAKPSGSGPGSVRVNSPATTAPAAVPTEHPPEKPRPLAQDTPEMRTKFLEQVLLSAFELDWR